MEWNYDMEAAPRDGRAILVSHSGFIKPRTDAVAWSNRNEKWILLDGAAGSDPAWLCSGTKYGPYAWAQMPRAAPPASTSRG